MFSIQPEFFIPFLVFAIPIIAIVGGITMGVVKALGQQRALELAARERLAAIERGIDPAKLPPMPWADPTEANVLNQSSPRMFWLRLLIGGIIVTLSGVGISIFLYLLTGGREGNNAWAVGLIPGLVGLGLLISAWVVRMSTPSNGGTTTR